MIKQLEIKQADWMPCLLEKFTINGKKAKREDFGTTDSGGFCGVNFIPKEPSNKVLKKYKINETEYNNICKKLEKINVLKCNCCD